MRILIATAFRAVVGGTEAYLRRLLPALAARGHDLGLWYETPAPPGAPAVGDDCPGLTLWPGTDPDRVAAEWRPDVCYLHGLADLAAQAAFADRFPTAYYAHNYGGLCASGTKQHGFPAPRPCTRRFGPACLALYLPRRCGGWNPATAVTMYRDNLRRRATLRRCRAVLVASRHMAAEVARNGVPADRVHLAPLPLTAAPDPHPPAPRPPSGRVLFVGRVTAPKGWSYLAAALPAAAAALGRRLTLVVAGDGPDREAFEAEARRRGVAAEFLGWVGADRRDAEARAADVLAVPSVWPEPFGLVGLEAGCVGLPAVGFAVGGIPDWLAPGVSGELAPGDRPDPRDLAAALVRALADEAHWQRLRVGAWETTHRFTLDRHVDRLLAILSTAAGAVRCESSA